LTNDGQTAFVLGRDVAVFLTASAEQDRAALEQYRNQWSNIEPVHSAII